MDDLISVDDLSASVNDETAPILIDVRSPGEYSAGHLPNAINIPFTQIEGLLDNIPVDKQVVVYCNMSHPGQASSERAALALREMGYKSRALKGGFPAWEQAGHPVDYQDHSLSQDPSVRRSQNKDE